MKSVRGDVSFREFQDFIRDVYGVSNDRSYSVWDLLAQQQRFSMRALKGVRKNDTLKVSFNLLIALSWLMNIANRFHIDVGNEVWRRFPKVCSYCGTAPCSCKETKPLGRKELSLSTKTQPQTIKEFQTIFANIYPAEKRTLSDAGVHLAEEVGEVNEAVSNYLGQHLDSQLDEIKSEIADLISCVFGVANSAQIDIAHELSILYKDACHVCHHAPCECSFENVVGFQS